MNDCTEICRNYAEGHRAIGGRDVLRRITYWFAIGMLSFLSFPCDAAADDSTAAPANSYRGLRPDQWIAQLDDEDKEVRRRAAYALGQIGPAAVAAVPALIEAADDKQLEVGWYALDALGRIGPAARDAVPGIVEIVEKSADYPTLRQSGIRALGRIGVADNGAATAIESALKDSNGQIRVAAALALWRLEQRASAIDALAAELSDDSDRKSVV